MFSIRKQIKGQKWYSVKNQIPKDSFYKMFVFLLYLAIESCKGVNFCTACKSTYIMQGHTLGIWIHALRFLKNVTMKNIYNTIRNESSSTCEFSHTPSMNDNYMLLTCIDFEN